MVENKIEKINPRSVGVFEGKTYTKTSSELTLKAEADELIRCSELSISTENIFPVKMIKYHELDNSLTTELIDGRDLFLEIWNPTSILGRIRGKKMENKEATIASLKELGIWLAKYHNSGFFPEEADHAAEWLTESFISKLKYARDNKLLNSQIVEKIERKFVSEIQNMKKEDYRQENRIQISRIHGDFIVYNMLLGNDNRIHILDFADTRISSSIEDVARFYQNIWAISHTNSYRKRQFLSVADDFLKLYGLPLDIVESPYFKSIMTYNSVIHLVGGHFMRDLLSLPSRLELKQITNVGLKWVYKELS